MTVSELMNQLVDCDPDGNTQMMMQESWPFENAIAGLTTRSKLGSGSASRTKAAARPQITTKTTRTG